MFVSKAALSYNANRLFAMLVNVNGQKYKRSGEHRQWMPGSCLESKGRF